MYTPFFVSPFQPQLAFDYFFFQKLKQNNLKIDLFINERLQL